MTRQSLLARHALAVLGLVLAAAVLATLRGALWPFDLRATALMTLAGLAGVLHGWGLVWLGPLALSAAVPKLWQRAALWPVSVLAMGLLHWGFGPARGFAPLPVLGGAGVLALYAVPTALMLTLGSALRLIRARQS